MDLKKAFGIWREEQLSKCDPNDGTHLTDLEITEAAFNARAIGEEKQNHIASCPFCLKRWANQEKGEA
jgi:hypothetical protein